MPRLRVLSGREVCRIRTTHGIFSPTQRQSCNHAESRTGIYDLCPGSRPQGAADRNSYVNHQAGATSQSAFRVICVARRLHWPFGAAYPGLRVESAARVGCVQEISGFAGKSCRRRAPDMEALLWRFCHFFAAQPECRRSRRTPCTRRLLFVSGLPLRQVPDKIQSFSGRSQNGRERS